MARADNKRAASSYVIDEQSALRADLASAVAAYSEGRAVQPIGETIDKAAAIDNTTEATDATSEQAAEPTSEIGAQVEAVAEAILEGVSNVAEKAIDTLANLFGGGSSAPEPKAPEPAKEARGGKRKPRTMEEFLAREREQQAAKLQEIAKSLGESPDLTPEGAEEVKKRSRDRGGGQSL
jgi:hypothetical protein